MTEAEIQAALLREIGGRADCRIWRNNCGRARDRTGRVVPFGVPGQADLSGVWLAPIVCERCGAERRVGIRLEIEVKSARGKQTDAQRAFQRTIERMGGVYVLARSVKDVLDALGP